MSLLSEEISASLIASTNDISLVIDEDGVIVDVALGSPEADLEAAMAWLGKPWADTVTIESRPKIDLLLKDPASKESRWRQVNHPLGESLDVPVMYKTIALKDDGRILAVGRDLRQVSKLQQRLLDVQYSLERDYSRMNQAEIRYRMLFSMSSEAILFVDADSGKILEANPAAGDLLSIPVTKLINRAFPRGFSDNSNDKIEEFLRQVRAVGTAKDLLVNLADNSQMIRLSGSLVRREDGPLFLVRMRADKEPVRDGISHRAIDVINRSPDSFVVTDTDGKILAANAAFLSLVAIATDMMIVNEDLGRWLGRPGVDLAMLLRNLREHSEIRQFDSVIYPEYGDPVDIELSAVSAVDSDSPCLGFVIRRQLKKRKETSNGEQRLPHSLEDMADLVGHVPLKDLVRETTDMIERMCIDAALKMSDQSRASAAEMLGLSRQSLYVKLNRYGIGDREDSSD